MKWPVVMRSKYERIVKLYHDQYAEHVRLIDVHDSQRSELLRAYWSKCKGDDPGVDTN